MQSKNFTHIDYSVLECISYRTKLGKSLKNTLRKFDKNELFNELNEAIYHFTENEGFIKNFHRIKSLQSCSMKYDKYFPNTPTEKVFNDILGIRIIIDTYDIIDKIKFLNSIRIVDMRNGKIHDDGYRAIHVYYQKDHFHYPIEFQLVTPHDHKFNEWLHIYLYKYVSNRSIGRNLRILFDNGDIQTETDFRREMKNVLSHSKKIL